MDISSLLRHKNNFIFDTHEEKNLKNDPTDTMMHPIIYGYEFIPVFEKTYDVTY